MYNVQSVHYGQTPLESSAPVFYLIGPTRNLAQDDWHTASVRYFQENGPDCAVCRPMPRDGVWRESEADAQTAWQRIRIPDATVRIVWLPAYGPVSAAEFFEFYTSGPTVLGIADEVTTARDYILYCARENNIPIASTLPETLALARKLVAS